MPAQSKLGKETSLPIHLIDKCDFNIKIPIHGVYREGLKTSLDYFNVRDRLKVWPHPNKKGRYIYLDGNQRIDLIIDLRVLEQIHEHFNLNPEHEHSRDPAVRNEYKKRLRSIKTDPENQKLLDSFRIKANQSNVDVAIQEDLDEDDARLFVATYNRNHSKPDEAKIVSQVVDVVAQHQNKNMDMVRRMIRPEQAYINPLPPPVNPFTPAVAPENLTPLVTETPKTPEQIKEEKNLYGEWGPPPPIESRPDPLQKAYIPFGPLSLSREGHREISERILRCQARIFREEVLKTALRELEESLEESGDRIDPDGIVFEIALRAMGKHIKKEEKEQTAPRRRRRENS
jgi:hypothetical protein